MPERKPVTRRVIPFRELDATVFPLKDDLPVRRTPLITWATLLANVLAFLWQVGAVGMERSVFAGGAIPAEILTFRDVGVPDLVPPPFTILTSMFLHGGWGHIFFNMLFLWIFGDNVEDAMGHGPFLVFYLLCGAAGNIGHILTNPLSTVPTVGASGAIAGVLGAYFLLFPRARVVTIVPLFVIPMVMEVPAVVFLGLWFVLQFLSGAVSLGRSASEGGVAWWAHIGGFVFGAVVMLILRGVTLPSERSYGSRSRYR
mgnify:CR=1 FL=1